MDIVNFIQKKNLLKEIKILKRKAFHDERGFFSRLFCKKKIKIKNFKFNIKQINLSYNNSRGVIRGFHYQDLRCKEGKIILCLKGKIFDVVVDVRKKSKTYLKSFSVNLTENNNLILYIPPGFAHGFQTLEKNTLVLYLHNKFFNKKIYRTINPLDSKLGINWPVQNKIISKKDVNKKFL